MSSVLKLSSEIAQILDNDPVLAKSVIEVLGVRRAFELFELLEPGVEKENVDKIGLDMERQEIIAYCVGEIPLSELLTAYRRAGCVHS